MPRPSPFTAVLLALMLLAGAVTLAGCGQKGDLFLPDEPVGEADEDDA